MAETETTTETREKGRGLFGRRSETEEPEQIRSETEWVDTLYSYEGDDEEDVGAPFEGESLAGLPEEPGERTGWKRRTHDSIDEIESYIDNVLGTPHDPFHRLTRPSAREYGLGETRKGSELHRTRVEGLDQEILIAFPFPADEFEGARVIYETEGGYVLEVKRATGGDKRKVETHHFTISKVGAVAHVLDKLRHLDEPTMERAIEERAEADSRAPPGPTAGQNKEPVYEAEPGFSDRGASNTPTIPSEHAEAPSEAPAGTDPGIAPLEEEPSKKEKKSLFGRRKKDEGVQPDAPSETQTEAPVPGGETPGEDETIETKEKKGLLGRFGRKKGEAGEGEAESAPGAEDSEPGGRKKGFGFRRRKGEAAEGETEPEPDEPAS
ncbi:MAG: hypothetical protein KY455_13360 [Euryarchaeota archaeon]|nr:hypothetical protein [Euryarchaeota archaeon]